MHRLDLIASSAEPARKMPSIEEHLAHSKRTKLTLEYLCSRREEHYEWIAVVAFYRALHLSEAVLLRFSVAHDRSHVGRETAIKKTRSMSHIWKNYRPLWEASCISRYLSFHDQDYKSFATYLTPDDVVTKLVNHRLREIEKSVAGLLDIALEDM